MAQILPQNSAPPADVAAARLEATLASLPDDWTLLPERRIGGADGPEVGFVLVHPAIGIALVDLLPRSPEEAIDRLRGLLADEHIARADDALPVVGTALAADDIPEVGERLAAAFEREPLCDVADPNWSRRAVDLLLNAGDAAMLPLASRARMVEPSPDYADDQDEGDVRLAADEPAILSTPPARHTTFAAICAAVIAFVGIGGAAAYLLSERPADAPIEAAATLPPLSPLTAAPPGATAGMPLPAAPASAPAAPVEAPPLLPPGKDGLAAQTPPSAAPAQAPAPASTVADTAPPPPATNPVAATPAPPPVQSAQAAAAPPPPVWQREAKDKAPPRKTVAATAKDATAHAKQATKRVAAALDKRRKPNADADGDAAYLPPPQQRMANAAPARERRDALPDESDPPLDAGDLPAYTGSSVPPQASMPDLPPDAPMPPPAPFSPATAASGAPVMLLPPITAQSAR